MSIKILDNFITPQEASSVRTLLYKAPWYDKNKIIGSNYFHNFFGVFYNGNPVNDIERTDARSLILSKIIDTNLKKAMTESGVQFTTYLTGLYVMNKNQGYHCQTEIPKNPKYGLGVPAVSGYNCLNELPTEWIPSETPNRKYVCHIFINSTFEGGICSFPLQKIDVEPLLGRAVIYPADKSCLYGVRPINNGFRITLTTFFE